MDSKIAKRPHADHESRFHKEVQVADDLQEKNGLLMLINAFFKINDVQGRAIGLTDRLSTELVDVNLKMFDLAWEEALMGTMATKMITLLILREQDQ